MPGQEMRPALESGNGGLPEPIQKFFNKCSRHFEEQARVNKWLATRDKPNMVSEGNSGQINAANQIDLMVFRIPTGMRLLINRLMILSDATTPGAGKYTNAGAYWQLFDGSGLNRLSMPDFGPLDGSIGGASQIPMVNQYGTKGLIIETGELHCFLNLPAFSAGGNIAVMFTGWLEPPFPDSE